MLLVVISDLTHPVFTQKKRLPNCILHHLAFLDCRPSAKKCRPSFLHLAPKHHPKSIILLIFTPPFSPPKKHICPILHCILLQKPCCLLHFTLQTATFYLAFCCILPCVLLHLAPRFAALYPAFCSILPHILLQIARHGVLFA